MASPDFQAEALRHLDALYNFAMYFTHLRAWLCQMLRNTFLTFYRVREREAALADDGVPDWDTPMFHDAPEQDGAALEAHTDLERAMRRLPEDFRTVLLLAEVEGLPLEEVSRVMACPVGTVISRIFRAKERLRVLLRDYETR